MDFETTWKLVHTDVPSAENYAPPILYCWWERIRQVRWTVTWKIEIVEMLFCCCKPFGCDFFEIPLGSIIKRKEKVMEERDL